MNIPETTIDLMEKDGSVRMRLVAQLWAIKNQAYVTSFTLAVMAPVDFTDDDCAWLAQQLRDLCRQRERVVTNDTPTV